MPEQAVSSLAAESEPLSHSAATFPRLRRELNRPGPFAWRVTVPPTRDREGRVIGVTPPFHVRGLTRHEAAGDAARRLGSKLPRGTQITRVRLHEAVIDTKSPAPTNFSLVGLVK